jgi:formylmethanofuran dehydrogenase subunit B
MAQLELATSWIDGEPASFDEATRLAAKLLSRSRQALFFGMETDVAGARAAINLADRIGAVIDHAHSTTLLRNLDCMRENGVMLTTPGEARLRADFVLLVGPDPSFDWPDLRARCLDSKVRLDEVDTKHRIVWLSPSADAHIAGLGAPIELIVAGEGTTLAINLAVLRAAVKGFRSGSTDLQHLTQLAAELGSAKFGVAVWSARNIDVMALEMLNGLVLELNKKTRFSTLPLPPPNNAAGVLEVSGWMTGFPPRTGFGLGWPEHDPWRFDAKRLLTSGEADCALWISAFGSTSQKWPPATPVIALCGRESTFAAPPKIRFAIGRPGVDHDATLHRFDVGTLVSTPASAPSSALNVAATLEAIGARLDNGGVLAC